MSSNLFVHHEWSGMIHQERADLLARVLTTASFSYLFLRIGLSFV